MAINLLTKYGKQLLQQYNIDSIIDGKVSTEYDWAGAKTVEVLTALTVDPVDYNRAATSNRFGAMSEVQDVKQAMTLTQDKAFNRVVDKGNLEDQGNLKQAGKIMKLQQSERMIPSRDAYCFNKLCHDAGILYGTSTALSKANIADRVSKGLEALDDKEIPENDRFIFISAAGYGLLRLSPEFLANDANAGKAVSKGVVGEFMGAKVVRVPAGRWVTGVNFWIWQKSAVIAPLKLKTRRILTDVQDVDGAVIQGRDYYDAFVLGARANGVYVDIDTSVATICATPTQSSGTFSSSTAGASFKYTNDGSDPRYSATAIVANSESETAGTPIKVVAFKAGTFQSGVLEYTAS
jgi:hypothetical protein